MAAKFVYVRVFARSDRIYRNDWIAKGSWIGIGVALWVIAWIIAESIPVFNNLLSLIVCDGAIPILSTCPSLLTLDETDGIVR